MPRQKKTTTGRARKTAPKRSNAGPSRAAHDEHAAEDAARELSVSLEQRVAAKTAELRASEQRVRAVLDAAVDAIVAIDAAGTIEAFNAAAEHMFGYTADEAIGANVTLLMGAPYREHHEAYLRRYRETGQRRVIGRTREFTAKHKDGTEFPIQISVNEVAGQDAYTGIIRDLSEQKALQEEIVRIATLEQRRIGEELHDTTQQELTGLGLLAQNLSEKLAARDARPESELAAKLAAGIAEANKHVRSLSRGLVPVAVDAEGLMVALEDLANSIEDKYDGTRCRFECPAKVELTDDVVAAHLYRIAQEACTNAVRHSGGDEVTIRLDREGYELVLEIVDNGKGIEPASGDTEGLGMRIMAHRCSLIGGVLDVRGRETGGTAVVCRLTKPAQD